MWTFSLWSVTVPLFSLCCNVPAVFSAPRTFLCEQGLKNAKSQTNVLSIDPSIIYMSCTLRLWRQSQLTLGERRGYTETTSRDKQPLTMKPMSNLEFPIYLNVGGSWSTAENTDTGRTCQLHKQGFKPVNLIAWCEVTVLTPAPACSAISPIVSKQRIGLNTFYIITM